jgi:hypothetical protein
VSHQHLTRRLSETTTEVRGKMEFYCLSAHHLYRNLAHWNQLPGNREFEHLQFFL